VRIEPHTPCQFGARLATLFFAAPLALAWERGITLPFDSDLGGTMQRDPFYRYAFYFHSDVLAFTLALIVWVIVWGAFDAALRAPPPRLEPVRAVKVAPKCIALDGRMVVFVPCRTRRISH
jgi:hypothetical protein